MNAHSTHALRASLGATAAALLLALLGAAAPAQADPVPPQVLNLVSAQRPGTFLVDVSYDLIDSDSPYVCVTP